MPRFPARLPGILALLLCLPVPAIAVAPDGSLEAQGLAAFREGRFAEAYQSWRQAEAAGDGRAARDLGMMADTGQGVPQDHRQAVEWYREGARLDDPESTLNLAICLDSGIGTPRDPAQAAFWYRKAAELHVGRAAYNLAMMLRDGDGVRRDGAAARRMFAQAASDGVGAARAWLPKGHVTREPPARSDDSMLLAAQRALLSRTPQAAMKAVALFRQAAASGGPAAALAAYDLAWCYQTGTGVEADRRAAYGLYLRAAAQTDDATMRRLAEGGAVATDGAGASAGPGSASPPSAPETPGAPRTVPED